MTFSHGKDTDAYVNGYVLSSFFKSMTFSATKEMADATTFKKNSKVYVPGLQDATLALDGIFDGAADAVDEVLQLALASDAGSIVSYMPNGDVFAKRAYCLGTHQSSYEVNSDIGDVSQISGEFQGNDTYTPGLIHHIMQAEGALGNGSGIDSGVVSTPNGGMLYVQMTTGASLVVVLQDSADGVTFADVAGGSITVGSIRTAKSLAISGTIRRHTRVRWTGSGTFFAVFGRK